MLSYFTIVYIAVNILYYKYIVYMSDTISSVIIFLHVINLILDNINFCFRKSR